MDAYLCLMLEMNQTGWRVLGENRLPRLPRNQTSFPLVSFHPCCCVYNQLKLHTVNQFEGAKRVSFYWWFEAQSKCRYRRTPRTQHKHAFLNTKLLIRTSLSNWSASFATRKTATRNSERVRRFSQTFGTWRRRAEILATFNAHAAVVDFFSQPLTNDREPSNASRICPSI